MATVPRLLLLDEVMAGLRPTEVDEMVAVFRRINAETGLTILLIEHVMRAVMALAGRVVVLHHGEKLAEGTPVGGAQPGGARVLSRGGGFVSALLEIQDLDLFYGDAQASAERAPHVLVRLLHSVTFVTRPVGVACTGTASAT